VSKRKLDDDCKGLGVVWKVTDLKNCPDVFLNIRMAYNYFKQGIGRSNVCPIAVMSLPWNPNAKLRPVSYGKT
jgi:hypothetical protein